MQIRTRRGTSAEPAPGVGGARVGERRALVALNGVRGGTAEGSVALPAHDPIPLGDG